MKKLLLVVPLLIALLTLSCEDSLSPKAEFQEEYALYGVINVDSSYQTITLTHSYQVEGFNGLENKVDPAIEGADVRLSIKRGTQTIEYKYQPATAPRADVSRYTTPFKFYSINNYKPLDDDMVTITAVLPNGKTLKASALIPPVTYLFYTAATAKYDPLDNEEHKAQGIKFAWSFLADQYNKATQYFAPRLEINYHKADNPANKLKIKVPYYFVQRGDVSLPAYPTVTNATTAQFFTQSIEKSLQLISEGDSVKSNYVIDGSQFVVLLLDKNLASYLAAENTFKDEFSIRIDAADFTNITGGMGMFGAAATARTKVEISAPYIRSFGYKTSY